MMDGNESNVACHYGQLEDQKIEERKYFIDFFKYL